MSTRPIKRSKLLPKETAFVWHFGGRESQREAFEKTAACDAYFRSGLVPALKKFAAELPWEVIKAQVTVEADADLTLQQIIDAYGYLYQRGFTMAFCLPEDDRGSWPYQLFVIPDAGMHVDSIGARAETTATASLAKRAAAAAQEDAKPKKTRKKATREVVGQEEAADEADALPEKLLKAAKAKKIADDLGEDEPVAAVTAEPAQIIGFDKITYKDRTIYCLHRREGHAKVDWACWQNGRDLVVYFGRSGVELAVDKTSNNESITTTRIWQRAWQELDHPIAETSRVWCDVVRLVKRYGSMTIVEQAPEPITVAKLLKPLGVDEIESIAWRWGYHGRHLVDVLDVVTPQPRQEILVLYDQPTVSLDRLPPLPVSVRSFSVQSFNVAQTWDQSAKIITGVVSLLPEELGFAIHNVAAKLTHRNAAELRRDLFASLGNALCTWSDTDQEFLSLGRFNLAISVKDAAALQKTLDQLFELIQQQGVDFAHTASTRHGCPFYVFASRTSAVKPCVALCDGWLILGLQPQTVEATVLRSKGRLPRWNEDVAKSTGVEIPKSFSGLTWSDPRSTVRLAMSLMPWLADLWSANAKEFAPAVDFSSLDIPPAELVAQPLFPNVTTTVTSPDQIRWTTWSSTQMNDSVVTLFQAYAAVTVVANLWGEEPFEFLFSLLEEDDVQVEVEVELEEVAIPKGDEELQPKR